MMAPFAIPSTAVVQKTGDRAVKRISVGMEALVTLSTVTVHLVKAFAGMDNPAILLIVAVQKSYTNKIVLKIYAGMGPGVILWIVAAHQNLCFAQ